jgi:hypothetical protein
MEYHLFLRQQSIAMRHGLGYPPSWAVLGARGTQSIAQNEKGRILIDKNSTLAK